MGPIRSEQMCSRCRNHGISSILKGHKRSCKFLFCTCSRCNETKMRQKCIASEIAIHRKHLKMLKKSESPKLKQVCEKLDMKYQIDTGEHRRSQMCARCKNHGIDQQLRGHKNECQFANCPCVVCEITAKRRTIMAKQIRDYRQTKLIDETDIQSLENFDENSSSEEELPVTVANIQPAPHFFDKFYMVQTLYDKFLNQEPTKQIQLLYALVNLSGENCLRLERALEEGKNIKIKIIASSVNFL